jgi:hypothetical protein
MSQHEHERLTFLDDFEEQPEPHYNGVYKGLGCLAGMYVFFLIEKIVQMKQVNKQGPKITKLDKLMKKPRGIRPEVEFSVFYLSLKLTGMWS